MRDPLIGNARALGGLLMAAGCFVLIGCRKGEDQSVAQDRRGCDRGDATSCYNLGVRYDNGRSVGKDEAKAATLFQKACDLGEKAGCYNLGVSYHNGNVVPKDEVKAAALFTKACGLGIAPACDRAKPSGSG